MFDDLKMFARSAWGLKGFLQHQLTPASWKAAFTQIHKVLIGSYYFMRDLNSPMLSA